MPWYDGTFACGHKGRVYIVGDKHYREWRLKRAFDGLCEECSNKKMAQYNKEDSEKYGFPELTGTEKQILWANKVRLEFFRGCIEQEIVPDEVIQNETNAKFWMDNRYELRMNKRAFLENYFHEKEEKEELERLIDEDTVRPKEIKYNGIVEITNNENKIRLHYMKNDDFIKIVKEHGYSWDGVWERSISATTGSFADRAAEIGHALLQNGFCICIHDEEARQKAISGNYEEEHTRWIYSSVGTKDLSIWWQGMDKELYARARKLPGSRYNSPYVEVDVCNYEEIEEFAEENGFRFTEAAREKIESYKKELENVTEADV